MTAKRLMVLSLILSVVGIAVLLFGQKEVTASVAGTPKVEYQKVLVAKQAIEVGQPFTVNMFKWKQLSDKELENYLDYISIDEFAELGIKAGIAHISIKKGQVMSADDFVRPEGGISMAYSVRSGFRAISVPVDEVTANSGFVQPGDKVDILMLGSQVSELKKYDNLVQGLYVTTIAKDVRVLAFNELASSENFQKQRSSYGANLPDNSSVSLEVTPEQATQIVLANQIGKLTLSLRGASDSAPQQSESFTVTSELINPQSKQVAPGLDLIQLRPSTEKTN